MTHRQWTDGSGSSIPFRTFVGSWRERFVETGEVIRPVALCMAATHPGGGRDVIMLQYLGDQQRSSA